MAARRVSASIVDWGALAAKIPAENKATFTGLKMKVDKHLKAVNALPENIGAIDFEVYRSKIAIPGMVDKFEKAYKDLKVPYPSDQGKLAEIDAQAVESKANYTKFVAESNARIANFNAEVAKWEAMKPIEEMNLEEALDAGLTQFVIDPAAQTPWPHEESWDQYKERASKADPSEFH